MSADEIKKHNRLLFKKYAKELSALPNVSASHTLESDVETWEFTSITAGSHSVSINLFNEKSGASWVSVDIEGAYTGYWNTVEEEQVNYKDTNLDFYIELAKASLAGEVRYNRSRILQIREICFKHGSGYCCTRVDGDYRYSYTAMRKHLRGKG
jgi:hypothetical protein